MPRPLLVTFSAGSLGDWRVERIDAVIGEGLAAADRLAVHESTPVTVTGGATWSLRGVTSNARYAGRAELDALARRQEGLRRPSATRAALIPIRKTEGWWTLAQDERRAILEEQSRHIAIGMEVLPAVSRRLHHSRELHEPFDFLTWFEYAPEHAGRFEDMVRRLRDTPEWGYVDREIDIRLSRS